MDRPRIVVEVRGGVVSTVSCDVEAEVIVVDYDDMKEPGGAELPCGYVLNSILVGAPAIRAAHERAREAVQDARQGLLV